MSDFCDRCKHCKYWIVSTDEPYPIYGSCNRGLIDNGNVLLEVRDEYDNDMRTPYFARLKLAYDFGCIFWEAMA